MTLVTAGVVVLDCAEPEKLARFYTELLDADQTDANANRVELRSADGFRLALRRDVNATAPSWPRPENSLQAHLEFVVEDLDAVERRIVGLGGRPVEATDTTGPLDERGYADPAGHSFTLRRGAPTSPKQG
ncbi:VOC family protein [Streptomyces sp. 15-116A]|uniref:VOC family protein n=1 Tax=Streptomyces sp. 15-116A TaxID=2259035 RepID=UPI0021B1EC64|nr:VOC family protein [Streptomyces sp. 15-116A]MCT7353548.1 VOC family protein [Streptomyces sp. 15-116A]